jgi:hypothetical protein
MFNDGDREPWEVIYEPMAKREARSRQQQQQQKSQVIKLVATGTGSSIVGAVKCTDAVGWSRVTGTTVTSDYQGAQSVATRL